MKALQSVVADWYGVFLISKTKSVFFEALSVVEVVEVPSLHRSVMKNHEMDVTSCLEKLWLIIDDQV